MNPVTLHLRPSSSPAHGPVSAVLVPGNDPQAWLAEAAAWPEAASREARLFVLPVSGFDPRPGGALIIPGAGQTVPPSARAVPCDAVFPGVWMPRGASLLPTIREEEATRLFLFPTNLIHPALGIIGWEARDALAPGQLLTLPRKARGASWEMATTGPAPQPQLLSIHLNLENADLSFLDEAGSGIGDKSHRDFTSTRGAGDKLHDALGDAAAAGMEALGRFIATGAAGLTGSGGAQGHGGGANNSGFVEFLRRWAAQQSEAQDGRRHRELERLMKLLRDNPEEGLRFALPLAGDDTSRGFAGQSGDRLTLRNPGLGNLGGGGGVTDPWNLNHEWRWKLQQRYREIAAEETRLGNFARAAYIYGELLGEWSLAASALMQGGLFREAARLHLLKTKSRIAAAECLEKGGLLSEAVELFAELGMHERCGDLFAQMGRRSEAFRSYLQAIRVAGNRVNTARILEEKLSQPGWAAAVLATGWPVSTEAIRCFETHFALLARCQAEEECAIQTERLAQNAHAWLRTPEAIRATAAIGLALPFAPCRERFALICRLAIARAVAASADTKSARAFLECLTDVEPDDPLLKIDVRRFVTKKVDAIPMPLRERVDTPIAPSRVIPLPPAARWLAFTSFRQNWIALSKQAGTNTLKLVSGDGEDLFEPQSIGAADAQAAWFVSDLSLDVVQLANDQNLGWGSRTLSCRGREIKVISTSLPSPPLALARTGPAHLAALVRGESDGALLSLATYFLDGRCLRTRPLLLGWADVPPEVRSLPFACIADRAFIALGNQVYMLEDQDGIGDPKLSSVNLPGVVTALAVSKPAKHIRVAVAWGQEVVLLSPEEKWEPAQLELCDLDAPALCFLPDGNLIIASGREAKVISVEGRIQTLATLRYSAPSPEPPVGVVSLDVSTCAILLPGARIEIFRMES